MSERKPPAPPVEDSPERVKVVRAPIDVAKSDLLMTAPPGTKRPQGWAVAISPEDLERFAFDAEQNPIYAWLALGASYLRGKGEPLEAHTLPIPVHFYLHEAARKIVDLVQDGNRTPKEKAAKIAEVLGFTRDGWNAFAQFERDAAAHYALHRRAQRQRAGAKYVEARDEMSGGRSTRTAERLFARGKRRGARPKPDKTPRRGFAD